MFCSLVDPTSGIDKWKRGGASPASFRQGDNALSCCTMFVTKQVPRGQPHYEISNNKFNVAPETAWTCNNPKRENVEPCRSNYGSETGQRNFNGEEVDWRTTHLKS